MSSRLGKFAAGCLTGRLFCLIVAAGVSGSGCDRKPESVALPNPAGQNVAAHAPNPSGAESPRQHFKFEHRLFEFEHRAMGIRFKALVYAESAAVASEAIAAGWAKVDELDAMLSDYRRDSLVMQLSRSSGTDRWFEVPDEFYQLLIRAREFSQQTGNAFDITVGPASHLWRAAIKRNRLPDESRIAAAADRIGWPLIQLSEPNQVRLLRADMQLDFGGIAQGYAADCVVAILRQQGIKAALVDASGDIVVLGTPPRQDTGSATEPGDSATTWRIRIPAAGTVGDLVIPLSSGSVSSSGDLEQSLVIDGKHHSHIVDPRSGRAVTHSTLVTVLAPTGMAADAWASALSVLPPDQALQLLRAHPELQARLVSRDPADPEKLVVTQSGNFPETIPAPENDLWESPSQER